MSEPWDTWLYLHVQKRSCKQGYVTDTYKILFL